MEQPKSSTYFQASRTGTYGFLAALPLFLLYEVLILFVNGNEISQIRVGADVWIKQALAYLGATGTFALGLLVLGIGMILGESTIYAVGVALLISTLVSLIFSIAPQEMAFIAQDATRQLGSGMLIVLSIGAGLYEELIFRVVLVGGLFWVLQSLVKSKNTAYIVAAIVGALLFSTVHYVGALGDTFTMSSFVFRFLFGLALNGIFLVRGFGVAAWTHAIYDVLVVTQMFG